MTAFPIATSPAPARRPTKARAAAVEQLKQVRYFWRQAHWLAERFPDAELRDVAGLVRLVNRAELAANDWSLTPGRYVGVAPEEEAKEFLILKRRCGKSTWSWPT